MHTVVAGLDVGETACAVAVLNHLHTIHEDLDSISLNPNEIIRLIIKMKHFKQEI